MEIYFVWTKSSLIGSKLIRWALQDDCSHFAIITRNPDAVWESRVETGCGGGRNPNRFFTHNNIVHSLTLKNNISQHSKDIFIQNLIESLEKNALNCDYDKKAIAFWALAAIGKRIFGMKIPEKNPWGTRGEHYCVEIIRGSEKILDEFLGTTFNSYDIEMLSPHKAFHLFLESSKLKKAYL